MDKIVMIAAAVAIIAILAVTLIMNPFGGTTTSTTTETTTPETTEPTTPVETPQEEEPEEEPKEEHTPIVIPEEYGPDEEPLPEGTYGIVPEEITGDCTLYTHVVEDELKCFGTAGNYSIMATNEYRPLENASEEYFCKPTEYGCKLYQKVNLKI